MCPCHSIASHVAKSERSRFLCFPLYPFSTFPILVSSFDSFPLIPCRFLLPPISRPNTIYSFHLSPSKSTHKSPTFLGEIDPQNRQHNPFEAKSSFYHLHLPQELFSPYFHLYSSSSSTIPLHSHERSSFPLEIVAIESLILTRTQPAT